MTNAVEQSVEYYEGDGGDVIVGTKEQLQAFGLGIGRAYPGEPGGPARGRVLRLRDPRGRDARVRWLSGDRFISRVELGPMPAGMPRPDRLKARPVAALAAMAQREQAAARDVGFQAALTRLVANALAARAPGQ